MRATKRPALPVLAILFLALSGIAGSPGLAAEGAPSGPWSFHSEVDLFLGLKAGAEYRFDETWGLRGCIGICAISPLMTTYTVVGVAHLSRPGSRLVLDLEAGLLQGIFNVLEPSLDLDPDIDWPNAYWNAGACACVGYRFGNCFLALRAGGGVLLGIDRSAGETDLSLQGPSFHPNLAIEFGYRPPARR